MRITPVGVKRYADLRLSDLIAGKIPVLIADFPLPETRALNQKISALELMDYELAEKDLAVSEKAGITLRGSAGKKSPDGNYYRAQTLENPADFFGDSGFLPFHCDRSFYFKSRIWLAGQDIRTPLHRDLAHNFILVLKGSKCVRLAAPNATKSVYSNSLFSRAPNFARLNLHEPDFGKFPRARDLTVYEARVAAGEVLYLPPLWWHDVKNTEQSISANFWFAPPGFWALTAKLTSSLNSFSSFWSRKKF